jgi:hypothetical protein
MIKNVKSGKGRGKVVIYIETGYYEPTNSSQNNPKIWI